MGVYFPTLQLIFVFSRTMTMTLTQQRACPGVKSWYWIRPSCAIMWHHEKHCVWCVPYIHPSPDRRRKNSQQWLGSCWSLSTLDVSLSVIIFHACHVDQIYAHSCSIYQASIMWDAQTYLLTEMCTDLRVSAVTWFLGLMWIDRERKSLTTKSAGT